MSSSQAFLAARDFLLAHVLTRCLFVPLETLPLLLLSRALFDVTLPVPKGKVVALARDTAWWNQG